MSSSASHPAGPHGRHAQKTVKSGPHSRSSNCLFTTHMQVSSQFRKPSSPLKQTHQKYIIHHHACNGLHTTGGGLIRDNITFTTTDIPSKITQINNMRRANACYPALKLLNDEITSDILKQNLWKKHLDAHWDHRHNTHIIWKTIHGLSNIIPAPTLNTSIHNIQQQNNNHTQTYCELCHQTIHKYCQTPKTNRSIDRATHKIQGYNITLTTTQVQEAPTSYHTYVGWLT